MALQKPFADPFGNINLRAYHKVIITNINWAEKKAFIGLGIYKDKQARDNNMQLVHAIEQIFPCEVEIQDKNGIKIKKEISFDGFFGVGAKGKNASEQAYLAFKELPDFKDAIDV